MNAPAAAPRHQQAVIISIVVAATAVTACALVAIAYMLGWVPVRHAVPARASASSPATQAAGGAADHLGLLPGESVVSAEEAAKGSPPATPVPGAASGPRPVTPRYMKAPESAPRPPAVAKPAPPTSPRNPPAPTSYERSARGLCVNCGTVAAITAFGDGEWDVRVRFEDGSAETLRYRTRPGLRIGQRVLLEEGRLIPD
jgi:hypothetical protein